MTPEKAYATKGRNPNTGYWVNDWHVYGSLFFPQGVLHEGEPIFGMRHISSMDFASGFHMGFDVIPTPPDKLSAGTVIKFLDRIADERGLPRIGIVISHSCWLSSEEFSDPDTADRGDVILQYGIKFEGMNPEDKALIVDWGVERGIHVIFDGDLIDRISDQSHPRNK
jgi:hypothetical protein